MALQKNLKLDPDKRTLRIKRTSVFLRNKEFSLLDYFLNNPGRVLTRTQILEDVWDRNICCATNTVDVHVSSLRRILSKHFEKPLIKTIHCVGYIFENDSNY